MVNDGAGSRLLIMSDTSTAAEVTQILGIEPTEALEAGWKRRRGRVHDYSAWSLDVDGRGEAEHFLASLSELLDVLDGKIDRLASLSDRYEMRLSWSGSSEGWQGGFVVPAELLAKLGPLGGAGVYIWGNVFLNEPYTLWERIRYVFHRYPGDR